VSAAGDKTRRVVVRVSQLQPASCGNSLIRRLKWRVARELQWILRSAADGRRRRRNPELPPMVMAIPRIHLVAFAAGSVLLALLWRPAPAHAAGMPPDSGASVPPASASGPAR
jgi:hypothetical protein